jgi:hypothetical protein
MKQLFVVVLLLAILSSTARAQAADGDDEDPPPPPRPAAIMRAPAPVVDADPLLPAAGEASEERYGLQVVAIDAAALVLGLLTRNPGVLLVGYAVGAPLVHVAHGNAGRAMASLAMHGGVPLGIGGALSSGCDNHFCAGPVFVGVGIAALVVTTIDAALLARSERKTERAPIRYGRVRASPTAAATANGLSLGIAGSF